jgi:hypothetical protein
MAVTTLEAQRVRLERELLDAEQQLLVIRQNSVPNFKQINFYSDLIVRNRELMNMIDTHLQLKPPEQRSGTSSAT